MNNLTVVKRKINKIISQFDLDINLTHVIDDLVWASGHKFIYDNPGLHESIDLFIKNNTYYYRYGNFYLTNNNKNNASLIQYKNIGPLINLRKFYNQELTLTGNENNDLQLCKQIERDLLTATNDLISQLFHDYLTYIKNIK